MLVVLECVIPLIKRWKNYPFLKEFYNNYKKDGGNELKQNNFIITQKDGRSLNNNFWLFDKFHN